MANDPEPLLSLGPLEHVVNVHFPDENDFVIYGKYGKTLASLQRFLIYSKDGIEWTRLATEKLPPITGISGLRAMVYGSGAWLAISNQIVRSLDKFETWELVTPFPAAFHSFDVICYGKPTTEVPNPPLDENGDPIRKGVFVAIGSNNSEFVMCSSRDQGVTWIINKVVSKSVFDYERFFVTFANDKFFVCAFGIDNNNGGFPGSFGPGVPGSCRLWTSEDGVTWDGGHAILGALTGLTWGSELEATDPSIFYVQLVPLGLVYKKESETYVISGYLFFGSGRNLWFAESSSPAFAGTNLGAQTLFHSPLGKFSDVGPPAIIHNGGTVGEYYLTTETNYIGGSIAAVGDTPIIAAQKWDLTESTVTFPFTAGPDAMQTDGYLVVSSDHEGVLGNYFCGGTFEITDDTGTDGHGDPIVKTLHVSEAGPALVAANSRVQPDAPEDSPGTFLWVRQFVSEQSPPVSNRGMEVRTSPDGSNFTIRGTPIGGTVDGFRIALGATPPED